MHRFQKLLKITFVIWIPIHGHKNIDEKLISTNRDEKMSIMILLRKCHSFQTCSESLCWMISWIINKNFFPCLNIQFLENASFLLIFFYIILCLWHNTPHCTCTGQFWYQDKNFIIFPGKCVGSNDCSKSLLSHESQYIVTNILMKNWFPLIEMKKCW